MVCPHQLSSKIKRSIIDGDNCLLVSSTQNTSACAPVVCLNKLAAFCLLGSFSLGESEIRTVFLKKVPIFWLIFRNMSFQNVSNNDLEERVGGEVCEYLFVSLGFPTVHSSRHNVVVALEKSAKPMSYSAGGVHDYPHFLAPMVRSTCRPYMKTCSLNNPP